MPLTPGTTLGPYEILAPIGAGGMGEVYKARDTRLDRTVAIKVLPEHGAADPDLKQRFEREAKTISSLNHPHICTLYDIGNQDGIDFLVMEYLEGETLAQRFVEKQLGARALRGGWLDEDADLEDDDLDEDDDADGDHGGKDEDDEEEDEDDYLPVGWSD